MCCAYLSRDGQRTGEWFADSNPAYLEIIQSRVECLRMIMYTRIANPHDWFQSYGEFMLVFLENTSENFF